MFNDFGIKIRTLRKQKNLSIEDLASKLGVSKSYVANLETSKTDTIQFSVLEKLQTELTLLPETNITNLNQETEFDIHLGKINHLLKELHYHDPKETEFLLHIIEKRYELSLGHTDSSFNKN
ncbi:helix-turn-helix domain-containing protein [Guptibacillus hwajinpoensis]|uniref:helix-turn-helix domain-containing protein n=1 Tax=Guptibacillus hwajinpoensis TaxID=208199 RepID=UPI001CFE04D8|nr:helix-turn-helix transcriptional regulator [Pseudalkalibacillus hwajinpoensis]WLR60634.1 helix-turn-helix transcriptional regulator [Pseudalkalibacillus hwajinpoensis]